MALKQRVQTVEYNSLSQEQNNVIREGKLFMDWTGDSRK